MLMPLNKYKSVIIIYNNLHRNKNISTSVDSYNPGVIRTDPTLNNLET